MVDELESMIKDPDIELAKLGIDYSFIYPEDHAKKAEMIKDRYLGL
ncbi:hypothetical protein [Limosilactobacillus reuteri]